MCSFWALLKALFVTLLVDLVSSLDMASISWSGQMKLKMRVGRRRPRRLVSELEKLLTNVWPKTAAN